eukprot:TRINITY_DN21428_c0_g1_i4.p1 TRINITY_DN21428_c0_g1~~TRINITY_DN21428_c0_g1_i4.p1  ORF type:complete len:126 (-),score=0.37 TRINITY_DN21428_c0_g1_i4:10-342(-)
MKALCYAFRALRPRTGIKLLQDCNHTDADLYDVNAARTMRACHSSDASVQVFTRSPSKEVCVCISRNKTPTSFEKLPWRSHRCAKSSHGEAPKLFSLALAGKNVRLSRGG